MTTSPIENPTTPRPTWSLQSAVTLAIVVSILVGMGSWTAWEYLTGERADLPEFLSHHVLPALAIGLIVWSVLTILIGRVVLRPINRVFEHLYRIGSGRLDPLEIETCIEDIRTVVDGVNLLVRRLKVAPENTSFGQAQDRLVKIRSDMKGVIDAAGDDADDYLEIARGLRALEGDLLAIARKYGK